MKSCISEKMDEKCGKRFVSCRINWEIENFCFACRPNNYTIFSPAFFLQGINLVKWRMILELKYNESCKHCLVSFYLEKLTISEQKNLHVNWEMTLAAGERIFGPYENSDEFGIHCKHGQTDITTTNEIMANLFPLRPDTLSVSLYFIVFDKEKPLILNEQPARGLFLLSEDLRHLKDTEESYTDIKLGAKEKTMFIEAHKAVLSRNETLKVYITEAKNDLIELSHFDYKILDKFVHFLYSGNVEYLLSNPSIALIRCMEHFDCNPIKSYYIHQELTMHSKIAVQTHEYHWFVPEILDKRSFNVTSPPIKRLNVNTTWNLTISRNSHSNYISIFANITDGDKPCYFCLEFAIISDAGEELFPRRLIRTNKCYENMGFEEFDSKDSLMEMDLSSENDCVRFLFRVRTSNGTQENSMVCHKISLVSSTEDQAYMQLSARMSDLLKNKNYSDISLKCGKKTIKAHKCILVSRSPEFRRRIDNTSLDTNTLILTDIEPDILEIMINYIYTGILEDLGGSRLLQLYSASSKDTLYVPSLREEILRILREKKAYITSTDTDE